MDRKPEKERAAERVSRGLENDVPEDELDPADAQRVAEATSSPQPEPAERPRPGKPGESARSTDEDGD